jgi:hypothetical protein
MVSSRDQSESVEGSRELLTVARSQTVGNSRWFPTRRPTLTGAEDQKVQQGIAPVRVSAHDIDDAMSRPPTRTPAWRRGQSIRLAGDARGSMSVSFLPGHDTDGRKGHDRGRALSTSTCSSVKVIFRRLYQPPAAHIVRFWAPAGR